MKALVALATFVLAAVYPPSSWQSADGTRYFDAHNHFSGVLPYGAYANLPAFIAGLADPSRTSGAGDRLALFRYLSDTWYPAEGAALGNRLFSPSEGQRYALGGRATLVTFRDRVATNQTDLDGALERVLSATPWTEFDSAYAFRSGPAARYLAERFYNGNAGRLAADLCKATVLDLAATDIAISEQSIAFLGGWDVENGRSERLDTVECPDSLLGDRSVAAELRDMGKPMPIVKFVLMTHTAQLATLPDGAHYSEWSATGTCAFAALPPSLATAPETIEQALLGNDQTGKPIVADDAKPRFFDDVLGIDTAAPETTCFTPTGMAYYDRLVEAVYRASKARRAMGWHGKLLVHTHVGEGAVVDYAPSPPPYPWTFASAFATLPSQRSNDAQAEANVGALLDAVAAFDRTHPDRGRYIVFRFAHDTWANDAQAQRMHDLGIEADVNLESNVATGAYPIARMPLGATTIERADLDPLLASPETNLQLNDLLAVLVHDPADPSQVGPILGNAALKLLLERHVRCLLGTDAAGVEHSSIAKEYAYAGALMRYWNATDPHFSALAAGATVDKLYDDVRKHLRDLSTDEPQPY